MTDVALRDYFDRRIEDLDKRIIERFVLNDKAISEAKETIRDRLESMNEFREALREQASRMATRLELEKVDEAVRELQRAKANLDGRLLILAAFVSLTVTVVVGLLMRVIH